MKPHIYLSEKKKVKILFHFNATIMNFKSFHQCFVSAAFSHRASSCLSAQSSFLIKKSTYYISEDSRPHEIDHLGHLIDVDESLVVQLLGQRGEGAQHPG